MEKILRVPPRMFWVKCLLLLFRVSSIDWKDPSVSFSRRLGISLEPGGSEEEKGYWVWPAIERSPFQGLQDPTHLPP